MKQWTPGIAMPKFNPQFSKFEFFVSAILRQLGFSNFKLPKRVSYIVAFLFLGFFIPMKIQAQTALVCYAVADQGDPDVLFEYSNITGVWTEIGSAGVSGIEAIAFNPSDEKLYTTNGNDFGTLDLTTGSFTKCGDMVNANGSFGVLNLSDVDGLTYDGNLDLFWATLRRGGSHNLDLLFAVDPATCTFISDQFGTGVDYIEVDSIVDAQTGNWNWDIDDIAVNPCNGKLYGISNNSANGGTLVIINTSDGSIDQIVGGFGDVDDMEGLGFDNDCNLYGSTGTNGPDPDDSNKLFEIDPSNGNVTALAPIDPTGDEEDFEALDCFTISDNTISGTVFIDYTNLGTLDGTDGGIPIDVLIYLDTDGDGEIDPMVDELVATVTPDANGEYEYSTFALGDFLITLDETDIPAGYELSTDNIETASFSTGGNSDPNNDFGVTGTGSIGDQLFVDVDGDGMYDPLIDDPIANVDVTLTLPNGLMVTVTTDAEGEYLFPNLLPTSGAEMYTVTVNTADPDFPADLTNTVDPDVTNNSMSMLTLDPGENDEDQDFGYEHNGSISNQLYEDVNGDGVYTALDDVLVGVTVSLDPGTPNDPTDDLTTVTNGSGQYIFDNLPAGEYTIAVVENTLPAGLTNTVDPDNNADNTNTITLAGGEDNIDQDFGYVDLVDLGNYIFLDENVDGEQSIGEDGVNGIGVELFQIINGLPVSQGTTTTTTNPSTGNDGFYEFTDLEPGTYYVTFDSIANGTTYHISPANQGGDETADSDVTNSNGPGTTDNILLTSGNDNPDIDAGLYESGSIGDLLWIDIDGDGIKDNGESGLDGITVTLLDENGNVLDTDETSMGGIYGFDDLPAGMYEVVFDQPAGYEFTGQTSGSDDSVDSNVDNMGSTGIFSFNPTTGDDLSIDAGVYEAVSLGDYVWNDANGDGIQDPLETGIAGVTVTLYNSADDTQVGMPDITDGSGAYGFDDLAPGTYYVEFSYPAGYAVSPADQGSDEADDSDVTGSNGPNTTDDITLVSGMDNPDIDAGIYLGGSISDLAFFDEDGDGMFNNMDSGITGLNVYLIDSNGDTIAHEVTGSMGEYLFDDVPTGMYVVGFETPAGQTATIPNAGNGANDSDIMNADGSTAMFPLGAGEDKEDVDGGFIFLVVPVEMLYFKGETRNDNNLLTWATTLEIDNDYFEIERRLEGEKVFSVIGRVTGNGTVSELQEYDFTDRDVKTEGAYVYRLKQVDYDGNYEYSTLIRLSTDSREYSINIFPNPTSDFLNLRLTKALEKDTEISIYNIAGQKVMVTELSAQDDLLKIDLGGLEVGNYILSIQDHGKLINKKFTVIR